MKLKGKVALITGAGTGLGRAMALALAREGADVSICDLDADSAAQTASAITKQFKRRAVAIKADVSDPADVDMMVDRTLSELGRIDILVNNAGMAQESVPTVNQSLENWERVIAVHLRGAYLCCRRAGQHMLKNGGTVLNISSIVGFGGFPQRTAYGPAKAGIINLTENLAVEWAKYNIRVNCIAPAYIATAMTENGVRAGNLDLSAILKRTPLGRLGTAEEIAKAAVFLVSDDSSYITGVTLPVDGGWLAYKNI